MSVRVSGLYRYPVQSVRGEELPQATFGPRGMPGDRDFAIVDLELGAIAHSSRAKKNYRPLITWHARFVTDVDAAAPVVELDFADGSTMRSDDTQLDAVISERLGMPAAFVKNDGRRVPKLYELSHCHLLTTATLKRLQQEHARGNFAPARFRPNIMLDAGDAVGFIEEDWIGHPVAIGGATFNVNDVCKRCAMTTRAQGDLPDDPGILHATAANKTNAGVYSAIASQGTVKVGDAVKVVA
ncbi:MOSC domain-containing protein [Dongia rigui]|uniref:MOSC domain-containing protein n=1 Tax=Dongia rigui TaxID=940149 RepID=A0ABU5DVD0_9PROT|nr:MOSC domain-containing protein [Dongia rigui]MDY0871242.1 MOSC domain-containing protein [Dongia rigui]